MSAAPFVALLVARTRDPREGPVLDENTFVATITDSRPVATEALTSGGAPTMSWMDRYQLRPPEWVLFTAGVLIAVWVALRLDRWLRFRKFGSPEFRKRERRQVR